MTRNLILGSAAGFDADDLVIFLRSAAVNAPSADVLLMSDRPASEFEPRLREMHPRVHVAQISDASRRRRLWHSARRRKKLRQLPAGISLALQASLYTPWRHLGLAAFHAGCAKHFWNLEGLNHPAAREAEMILVADTRDLLFQADPFEGAPLSSAGLLMAAEPRKIETTTFVYRLIQRIHSAETAGRMLGRPILCSGAVLGRRDRIHEYLEAMSRELNRHARSCFGRFVDQPLHCKILLADRGLEFETTSEGEPWITNLLYLNDPIFRLGESGVTTMNGDLIRIVHRYDRFPKLVQWAERKFGKAQSSHPEPAHSEPLTFPTDFDIVMGSPAVLEGSRPKRPHRLR